MFLVNEEAYAGDEGKRFLHVAGVDLELRVER
jgi:hypothetical protein